MTSEERRTTSNRVPLCIEVSLTAMWKRRMCCLWTREMSAAWGMTTWWCGLARWHCEGKAIKLVVAQRQCPHSDTHIHNLHVKMCHLDTARRIGRSTDVVWEDIGLTPSLQTRVLECSVPKVFENIFIQGQNLLIYIKYALRWNVPTKSIAINMLGIPQ